VDGGLGGLMQENKNSMMLAQIESSRMLTNLPDFEPQSTYQR
jgi:hypothetical protein